MIAPGITKIRGENLRVGRLVDHGGRIQLGEAGWPVGENPHNKQTRDGAWQNDSNIKGKTSRRKGLRERIVSQLRKEKGLGGNGSRPRPPSCVGKRGG